MSFDVRKGQKMTPVGKSGLMSRNKANFCLATTGAFANLQVTRGQSDDFFIHANNAVLQLKDESPANSTVFHPFKLYATGETKVISGITKFGYQVRSGVVEVRPRFHLFGGGLFTGSNTQGNYSTPFEPSNADGAIGDANVIVTPSTFFLDPTPEIVGGVNYGAYYAFWVRIAPDSDNGGAYDGSVTIQFHRYSINPGASAFDQYVFPGLPDINGYENLPVAAVQVTTETAFGVGFGPGTGDGSVYQFKHDHYTGRFPAGQSGLNGFCWIGDWSDPAVGNAHRVYYPGDMLNYNSGTPHDPFNGFYVWIASAGVNGSAASPFSGVGAWAFWPDGT